MGLLPANILDPLGTQEACPFVKQSSAAGQPLSGAAQPVSAQAHPRSPGMQAELEDQVKSQPREKENRRRDKAGLCPQMLQFLLLPVAWFLLTHLPIWTLPNLPSRDTPFPWLSNSGLFLPTLQFLHNQAVNLWKPLNFLDPPPLPGYSNSSPFLTTSGVSALALSLTLPWTKTVVKMSKLRHGEVQ